MHIHWNLHRHQASSLLPQIAGKMPAGPNRHDACLTPAGMSPRAQVFGCAPASHLQPYKPHANDSFPR